MNGQKDTCLVCFVHLDIFWSTIWKFNDGLKIDLVICSKHNCMDDFVRFTYNEHEKYRLGGLLTW